MIVQDKISLNELKEMSKKMFGGLVKIVVDIERKIISVDMELHSDEESELLEDGSKQENLWGINIYPDKPSDERIEFDSMINLRPSQGNMSRSVDDPNTRQEIIKIINSFITE